MYQAESDMNPGGSMTMSTTPKDRIVRIYETTVWPDKDPDGPYEPNTITLGYPVDTVPDDPYSDAVRAEALRVWIKCEIKAGRLDEDHYTTFELTNLRLKQSKFYRAADTFEAGVARRDSARGIGKVAA